MMSKKNEDLFKERLFHACQQGKSRSAHDVIMKYPNDNNHIVNCLSADLKTPLYVAIAAKSLPLVRLLLKHGADVNKESTVFYGKDCSSPSFETCQEPPVVTAARVGCPQVLQCLIRNGCEARKQSDVPSNLPAKEAAPSIAERKVARRGRLARVLNEKTSEDKTALEITKYGSKIDNDCHGNNEEDVKERSNRRMNTGRSGTGYLGMSALHHACEACQIENVRLLLRTKPDVNVKEGRRMERPLHLVARCQQAMCERQCDIIELLCSVGGDFCALNKKRLSPFYLSCLYGCSKKIEIFLKYGASPNPYDHDKRAVSDWGGYGSGLHIAAYKDFLQLAVVLVNGGANLNWKNSAGLTPLQLNVSERCKSNIAALLIFHGAQLNEKVPSRLDSSTSAIYNNDGMSLLSKIISTPRLDCESLAILLVQAGYNLNQDHWLIPDIKFDNPLLDSSPEGIQDLVLRLKSSVNSPAEKRVSKLCKWLRYKQQSVRSLLEMCRAVIRNQLVVCGGGKSIVSNIGIIPLPIALKNYLLLKNINGKNLEPMILNCLEELQ